MPKKTSKKKPRKNAQNRITVRKAFSESEVGVLIEDLDHKMDLLLEGFSAQSSRMDRIEETVFQIGQKILIIEDKMAVSEDKLIRLESVVASLADTVAKNTQDIHALKSGA